MNVMCYAETPFPPFPLKKSRSGFFRISNLESPQNCFKAWWYVAGLENQIRGNRAVANCAANMHDSGWGGCTTLQLHLKSGYRTLSSNSPITPCASSFDSAFLATLLVWEREDEGGLEDWSHNLEVSRLSSTLGTGIQSEIKSLLGISGRSLQFLETIESALCIYKIENGCLNTNHPSKGGDSDIFS